MSRYLEPELLGYPFDQYQRYRLIAELLDRLREPEESFEVLEVGGFQGLAKSFLPQDQIIVADLFCRGEAQEIFANAESLPFPNHSFPVVMALDLLEHLQPEVRAKAISEMARVSSELVLVSAPFQYSLARSAEEMVFNFIKDWLGYEHKYLKEHLEIKAPDLIQTESELIRAGFDTIILPNGQLERWLLMMLGYYFFDAFPSALELRKDLSRFYNQHYFWKDLSEPAYRHLIVASRTRLRENPNAVQELLEKKQTDPEPEYEKFRLWLELFRAGEIKRALERISQLEDALKEKENAIKHLENYIAELEDFHKKVRGSWAYRIYQALFKRG